MWSDAIFHVRQVSASAPNLHSLPPPRTTPRRFAPTATEKSRQRRARFQHRATSSMPLYRAPQHFTSVGYQLQLQTCTPFPPPPTTLPCRFAPTDTEKSRQRRVRFQHRVTSSMPLYRAPQHFTSVGYRFRGNSSRRHRRINSSSWR